MLLEQIINKDDLAKAWENYSSQADEKSKNHYFLNAKRSGGEVLQIEVIASTISYVGKPAVIGTVIDITEQVAEEKRISKAVSDAQENERQQISMELHDSVKQMMAASLLNIDFLKMLLKEETTASPIINNTKTYIREAIEELRRITHQLAPSVDETVSLEEKIKTVVDAMNVSKGLYVSYHFDRFEEPIKTDVQLAMYRILQEQFSNILKYANASAVDITVQRQNGHIAMSIQDNGLGFDTATKKHGIGLENIKRRIRVFNGHFKIQSSPGKGCKLDVQIPLTNLVGQNV
jgi:signal transduction histidine kinase